MWKALQEQYEGKGFNIKNQAFTELLHLRYGDYDNVSKFIIRFKSVKNRLDTLEFKLPEEAYVIIFIEAMNEKFPTWAQRQRSNARAKFPSLDDLIHDITDEARDTPQYENAQGRKAMYSNKPSKGKNKNREPCKFYKKENHHSDNCYFQYPEKAPKS
ncbi:hypothetical protein BP6252_00117 [Coleophoma cylindrospora]|uniref:Uncharacterized protein n=1 Tax=Coleophoma cylindrospora TaxID=1849047 RepID=A0A3D8SP35_9HELO|nr:hypothetical protein BP6252_00117 [Coleophoma cylindrospora]